jgi:hypothetical protein
LELVETEDGYLPANRLSPEDIKPDREARPHIIVFTYLRHLLGFTRSLVLLTIAPPASKIPVPVVFWNATLASGFYKNDAHYSTSKNVQQNKQIFTLRKIKFLL